MERYIDRTELDQTVRDYRANQMRKQIESMRRIMDIEKNSLDDMSYEEIDSLYRELMIDRYVDVILPRGGSHLYQRILLHQLFLHNLKQSEEDTKNVKSFSIRTIQCKLDLEKIQDEYRKLIDENKYGRIALGNRQISLPRIQCTESHGNNIKYDSRRLFNDLGK